MMAGQCGNFKRRAMHAESRPVSSSQQGCHRQLETVVRKHLAQPSRRPPAPHTKQAFDKLRDAVNSAGPPLIFDSFCGTGMSTALLARRYADSLVIGIDKSAHRLAKHGRAESGNYLLVQAECGDFWRLALDAGWTLSRHFLLYPNPWPKPGQLQRRIHGSADFADLLALGGSIELRSNWQVYVEEFAKSLELAGQNAAAEPFAAEHALSLFERKYQSSGHELWRCRCKLSHNMSPRAADKQAR
jgi:tRNA G46 methylase TrmB